MMSIIKEQLKKTNEISYEEIHVDDKFLQDHLKDVRSEMSWRRELELRLMQFLLIFYPIIGTAVITLFQSKVSVQAFTITVAGSAMLILLASIFITDRIVTEHRAYAELGKEVQNIWLYFGLFKEGAYLRHQTILPISLNNDKAGGFGQGHGYKKTLGLIWLITVTLILVLVTLALVKV